MSLFFTASAAVRHLLSPTLLAAICLLGSPLASAADHDHPDSDHSSAETAASDVYAEHPLAHDEPSEKRAHRHHNEDAIDWLHGDGANIGGILFPELFTQGVFGASTIDPALLSVGEHDPQANATLQSLHVAVSLEVGEILSGFVNYDGVTDANGNYEGGLEEGFIHLQALDWLSIGGGQFLNSFGFQNERHTHAWDFVDQHLANGRMLNRGELTSQGGEVIINLPTSWTSTLTIGGGGVATHDHGDHDHGEQEHESAFEAEGANFDNWVVTGNYRAEYGSHEHMAGTVSAAIGENGFGGITQVYGIGHEIIWNPEKPLYDDAKNVVIGSYRGGTFHAGSLRWRTELMLRSIEAIGGADGHHEEDHHGEHEADDDHDDEASYATLEEFGVYTMLQYGITDLATAGLRAEWVSGIDEFGLEERWRVSPNIGIYLNRSHTIRLRLQYNFDYSESYGDEHSVWLQVGYTWGAPSGHGHHQH